MSFVVIIPPNAAVSLFLSAKVRPLDIYAIRNRQLQKKFIAEARSAEKT